MRVIKSGFIGKSTVFVIRRQAAHQADRPLPAARSQARGAMPRSMTPPADERGAALAPLLVVLLAIGFTAAFGLTTATSGTKSEGAAPAEAAARPVTHRATPATATRLRPVAALPRFASRPVSVGARPAAAPGGAAACGPRRDGGVAREPGAGHRARAEPGRAGGHHARPELRRHACAARRTAAGAQADRPGRARARVRLLRRLRLLRMNGGGSARFATRRPAAVGAACAAALTAGAVGGVWAAGLVTSDERVEQSPTQVVRAGAARIEVPEAWRTVRANGTTVVLAPAPPLSRPRHRDGRGAGGAADQDLGPGTAHGPVGRAPGLAVPRTGRARRRRDARRDRVAGTRRRPERRVRGGRA